MPSHEIVRDCGRIGRFENVTWSDVTGSTNADAGAAARAQPSGSPAPIVKIADVQTAGRGRRDRTWEMAPGGGVLMSFFVPWRTRTNAALVPLAVGVALADAVAATGRRVALKWPNDLVAIDGEHQDRKVAGMLSELINDPRGRSAGSPDVLGVVIGCGINVSWPSPTDIAAADGSLDNAACLEQLGGDSVDRATFAFDLIERTDQELRQWEIEGAKNLVDRYRARCGTIGRRVRIDQADGRSLIGFATDVDDAGRLVLESSGSVRRIDVGDVDHLRPDDRM